jgi:hypothetical protein
MIDDSGFLVFQTLVVYTMYSYFLHSQVNQNSQQPQVQQYPIQADPITAVQQQFSGYTIKAVQNEQVLTKVNN